jgi:hypothetical protein
MDERLKKIIEDSDLIRQKASRKLQEEEEQKRLKQNIQNEYSKAQAVIWVKENIFSLIEKADREGEFQLDFSGYCYSDSTNYGCKIPAHFLIAEIKKIDGLIIEENYSREDICYDGPSFPAHWTYIVRWRPERNKR